ncbi:MAG: hypothetical protein K6E37_06845 [Bacteroidales bacterium]|nr:hypothetical protein [Bacteroidales bacterium]
MKRFAIFTVLLAALAACTATEPDIPLSQSFDLVLIPADTRTVNDGLSTNWADGDCVSVYHCLSGSSGYISDGSFSLSDASSNSFSGSLASSLEDGASYDWFVAYPYTDSQSPAALECTIGKEQSQAGYGSTAHLAGSGFPLYGILSGAASSSTPSISVKQMCSVLAVTVNNSGSSAFSVSGVSFTAPEAIAGTFSVDLTDTDAPAFTSKSASSTASVSVSGGGSIAAGGSAVIYMGIKPFTASAGDELTLVVSTSGGSFSKTLSLSAATEFQAGYIKTLNVSCDASGISVQDPYSQSSGSNSVSGITYESTSSDENAVKVSGGSFTMENCCLLKSGGDTSDNDGSSFYGINSALLSTGTGTVTMNGGTITTNAKGANGVVAYQGTVNISDVSINCSKSVSRGIHATGGGTINASNLNITTNSETSSLIATDRGGGTVTVNGGTYTANGKKSAVCYSTGEISVSGITGSSAKGPMCVVEGSNSIIVKNSTLTSGGESRGILLHQSGSGDASGREGSVTVTGGKLSYTVSDKPFIEVTTSMTGTVNLTDVDLDIASGILMSVDYTKHGNSTYAYLNLLSDSTHSYEGNVLVDDTGTATVTVGSGVSWTGAYDSTNSGKSTSVVVNGVWNLSGNSYVDTVTIAKGGVINSCGYTLTYDNLSGSGTLN